MINPKEKTKLDKSETSDKPRNMRCLVLGGNGFVGSHLVDFLLGSGYNVRILNKTNKPSLIPTSDTAEVIEGDITKIDNLYPIFEGCDICFHLISSVTPKTSNLDPIFDIHTNLVSTLKVLDCMVKANIKKIIFLSSGGTVYGVPQHLPIDETHPTNPLCSYGIIKLTIEKYLALYHQLYGLDYVILRVANLFGEGQRINASQGVIPVFLAKAVQKETITIWGDGTVVRDYIHVSDLITAMIKSIDYSGPERILNIGSGKGISINELLGNMESLIGKQIKKNYISGRSFDVPANTLSIRRAKNNLNWEPEINLSLGLGKMFRWLNG